MYFYNCITISNNNDLIFVCYCTTIIISVFPINENHGQSGDECETAAFVKLISVILFFFI
jgi:hypothetical protein